MGAWDAAPFGNDTACDWAYGLEACDDLSLIESTLHLVLDVGDDYLEAPLAEEAIAAADVLSRLLGKLYSRDAYTEAVDRWVAQHPLTPSPALIAKALKALERIQTGPSEALELWDGDEDWARHLTALKERLSV